MISDRQNVSLLLKELRKQLELSQEELARDLGVSFTSVNRWENGQVKPSKLAIAQLNSYCNKMIKQGRFNLPDNEI